MENSLNNISKLPLEYPFRQSLRIYLRRLLILFAIATLSLAILSVLTFLLNGTSVQPSPKVQTEQQQLEALQEQYQKRLEAAKRDAEIQGQLLQLMKVVLVYAIGICFVIAALGFALRAMLYHRIVARELSRNKKLHRGKTEQT